MDRLELPNQLKGSWDHCLIMSYGVDIPFFEHALWGQFATTCRNKIILADGQEILAEYESYADSGLVRMLNQQYVADGIFSRHSAHAKVILLTSPQEGRLLVGSGNLRLGGYASGGELFTRYEYKANAPEMLSAFVGIREVLEAIVDRHYIGAPAERRIRNLLELTPWLFGATQDEQRPVRHNLDIGFIEQLLELVDKRPVQELWVLSPFYDPEAIALRRLLERLQPQQCTLLVQPGQTSVDPTVLSDLVKHYKGRCQVRPFSLKSDAAYVHAKMYLIKMSQQAICLQGSPNLSQVAMLFPDPQGNIEVANLLTGARDDFDYLLAELAIEPPTQNIEELNVAYHPLEANVTSAGGSLRLTGGEWHDDRLLLNFQGNLLDLEHATLVIAGRDFKLRVETKGEGFLELEICPDIAELLTQPVPVLIRWDGGEEVTRLNPIFVCNRLGLENSLHTNEESEFLKHTGDLSLEDEEFERLFGELESALVIDRRSVWQLSGKTPPPTDAENEDAPNIKYIDVDLEQIKRHPKMQQYLRRASLGRGYGRSRLQIILSAIMDHFHGLLDISEGEVPPIPITVKGSGEAETEDEREAELEDRHRRRQTWKQRVQRTLKRFIRRYLQGLLSEDFRELAGPEVMGPNYVIFSHILWRLFGKDWLEPEFIIESLLNTWDFFWGKGDKGGYFATLTSEERSDLLEWIAEHRTDSEIIASLCYSAYWTRYQLRVELRLSLRDCWHVLLRNMLFAITEANLEVAWRILAVLVRYDPPSPTAMVEELIALALYETRDDFLTKLEQRLHSAQNSCKFDRQSVWSPARNATWSADCLVVNVPGSLWDWEQARGLLELWMEFESLDYYRIACPIDGAVIFYEPPTKSGVFWSNKPGEQPMDFGEVVPLPSEWRAIFEKMKSLAAGIQEKRPTLNYRPLAATAVAKLLDKTA